jgi:predicted XRE-type DNA-binding protein
LPNPEQELLKARQTLQIYRIVKERGLTQARAGELLGIKQPHVSALMRNRAGNFSIGRLMEFSHRARPGRADRGEADAQGAGGNVGGDAVKSPLPTELGCSRVRWGEVASKARG